MILNLALYGSSVLIALGCDVYALWSLWHRNLEHFFLAAILGHLYGLETSRRLKDIRSQ